MTEENTHTGSQSLPERPKCEEVLASGYDESDYGDNYWLGENRFGERRVDRGASHIINLINSLIRIEELPEYPWVADIGAGPGRMVRDIRDAGFECHGCEFSSAGRRIAKERYEVDLLSVDLREGIPYDSGWFDFVYCVGVLTMLPTAKLDTALSELARILRPGGILLTLLINPVNAENEPHITAMSHGGWRALHLAAGLEDVTSLWAPQKHGIGISNEFCGLFRKPKE